MPYHRDYAEISPVDLQNPFRNPTEQPDYSPDYSEILPEIGMPESSLSLLPSATERAGIRRFFTMTFLTLLFEAVTAMTVFVALRLIATTVLQQVDLRKLGTLPQNYDQIVSQFLDDSSIVYASNLIAFLIANTLAVLVGCKLTNLRIRSLFRLREFHASQGLCYIFVGLWLQLLAGILSEHLLPVLRNAGLPVALPDITLDGFTRRTAVFILYGCLVAPVTEELLLRGVVLKNLSRVSQRFGILLSALLFGLMHENLAQFLFTVPFGILLGLITVRHNSVTPAMLVHIAVNTAAAAVMLCERMLPTEVFRIVNISYTLGVLALGSVAAIILFVSERLPDQTPHQRMRSSRLVWSSPLLWVLVGIHITLSIFAAKA